MSLSPRVLHVLQAVFAQILVISIRNGPGKVAVVSPKKLVLPLGWAVVERPPLVVDGLHDGCGAGPLLLLLLPCSSPSSSSSSSSSSLSSASESSSSSSSPTESPHWTEHRLRGLLRAGGFELDLAVDRGASAAQRPRPRGAFSSRTLRRTCAHLVDSKMKIIGGNGPADSAADSSAAGGIGSAGPGAPARGASRTHFIRARWCSCTLG